MREKRIELEGGRWGSRPRFGIAINLNRKSKFRAFKSPEEIFSVAAAGDARTLVFAGRGETARDIMLKH